MKSIRRRKIVTRGCKGNQLCNVRICIWYSQFLYCGKDSCVKNHILISYINPNWQDLISMCILDAANYYKCETLWYFKLEMNNWDLFCLPWKMYAIISPQTIVFSCCSLQILTRNILLINAAYLDVGMWNRGSNCYIALVNVAHVLHDKGAFN